MRVLYFYTQVESLCSHDFHRGKENWPTDKCGININKNNNILHVFINILKQHYIHQDISHRHNNVFLSVSKTIGFSQFYPPLGVSLKMNYLKQRNTLQDSSLARKRQSETIVTALVKVFKLNVVEPLASIITAQLLTRVTCIGEGWKNCYLLDMKSSLLLWFIPKNWLQIKEYQELFKMLWKIYVDEVT